MSRLSKALIDVGYERERQDKKWGEQNHPDGSHEIYTCVANAARAECDKAAKDGNLTWRHIATEEVFEAFAETDKAKLRTELVQAAAVLVAWVEKIDREATSG